MTGGGGPRPRWILAGLAALVVTVLVGGRWAAVETAERAWAAAVPGGAVYVDARDLARLVRGVVLFAATLWGVMQLYLVYRAIGSVQVPRRLGNIEIVEAVPQRFLLGVALGAGALYGFLLALGTGDWWLAAALAAEPPRFGALDPVLERDLGYYLGSLPWIMRLQDRALLASASGVLVVGFLYLGIGALRFEGTRPVAGPHARAHLGTLLATLALVFAWGALLDPAEVVAGAHGALDRAALTVRLPGSTAVVVAALSVAGLSLAWAWGGRPAVVPGAWVLLLVIQVTVYGVAPALIRAARGDGQNPDDVALANERAGLERLAFGLENLQDASLPEFRSPGAALSTLPLWDPERVVAVARTRAVFGTRATAAGAALYRPGSAGARPAWLVAPAPDAAAFQRLLPPPAWQEIHRGAWARPGAALLAVEADTGLAFEPAPVRDSVTWFGAGFTEFALASPDTWPALRAAGVPLGGSWRRVALALTLQSPELLNGEDEALLLWRRDVRERLARLLPPAEFDAAVPVLADGSLWWVAYGYVTSELFPLVHVPAGRVMPRYLRPGFVGVVHAASGDTRLYLAPGHDPLSAAWAGVFAPLVRPAHDLPAILAGALPFPQRSFAVAAAYVASTHADTTTWQSRPAEPFSLPAPTGEPGERIAPWMAQGFETARPAGFVGVLAGRVTPQGPALVFWRPPAPAPRPAALVGSPDMRPGVLRIWPAGAGLFSAQGQFAESVAAARSGGEPALARVYLWWGARTGDGPTPDAALRDLLAREPVEDLTLEARWDQARRLAARADSALARGDLQEFARLYQELRRVLAPPHQRR